MHFKMLQLRKTQILKRGKRFLLKMKIKEKLGSLLIFGGELQIADLISKYLEVKNFLCSKEAAAEKDIEYYMRLNRIPTIQKEHFALQPDANINLLNMIRLSIRQAAMHRSSETGVLLRRHTPAAAALVKKLFPGKSGEPVISGSR